MILFQEKVKEKVIFLKIQCKKNLKFLLFIRIIFIVTLVLNRNLGYFLKKWTLLLMETLDSLLPIQNCQNHPKFLKYLLGNVKDSQLIPKQLNHKPKQMKFKKLLNQ